MWVNKLTILLAAAVFLIIAVYSPASAREITVSINSSGADFKSIQEAVTNSSSGDVILVCPGNYNESVDITTQNISIFSESEDPEDTVVRGFNLNANNTTVSGFRIQEVVNLGEYISLTGYRYNQPVENSTVKNNILELGIKVDECYTTIEKNVILSSGIRVYGSDDTVITNFRISDNLIVEGNIDVYRGLNNCVLLNNSILKGSIALTGCCNCTILDNHVSNDPDRGSAGCGMGLFESYSNKIENNTFVNCSDAIHDAGSDRNLFLNNTISNSNIGIFLMGSHLIENPSEGDLLLNNTISNNSIGINLVGNPTGGDSLLNNTISGNRIGILFEGDFSNTLVASNKVELNRQYGVCIERAGYSAPYNGTNWLYDNIFNNTVNFFYDVDNSKSNYYTSEAMSNSTGVILFALNTTKTSGNNILGGSYLGGNYWAKPDGTGFSQKCVDLDGDGIGDLPYKITENETDYLPLVSVFRSQESVIPVANFSTDISQNLVPVTVQFTDFSKNAVTWSWDFDNDGIPDSTKQNPAHLYTTPGTYTVNLTVSNGRDISSKSMEFTLQEAKVPPVADFKTNITSGEVPLSIRFTDLSQNATSWIWDFNNDGTADSIEENPVYVYTYPGNYTVNLTVDNTKGTASKSLIITVSPAQHVDGELILTEYQITTNKSYKGSPTIYGDRIIWADHRNGNWDIYMYDLSTEKEIQITTNESDQANPAIYGDRIVWTDERNREYSGIYVYNISTFTETEIITNKSYKRLPAIYEDKIVWTDYQNGKTDVYMYNLSTSRETQVTTSESVEDDPAIYGDRIVWTNLSNGSTCIYNLSTSRGIQITPGESEQRWPVIYGDRIVWEDILNENTYTYTDIYMYNASTCEKVQITTSGSACSPAIYGNRIVWSDRSNGLHNRDIYMYDLSTNKETQVTTNESDQTGSAIYGDRIVWIDNRNDYIVDGLPNEDIYMCTVSEKEPGSKNAC